MSTFLYKPRAEGHYLGVGAHTVLVARHPLAGHVVTLDGYRIAERRSFHAALRAGQRAAQTIAADDHWTVGTLAAALATKGSTMTTDTRSAAAIRSANRRARLKAEAVAAQAPPTTPAERRAAVLAAHDAGKTIAEAASAAGVSQNRVRQILAATGRVRPKHRNQDRNDAITAAIDAGATFAEVAEKFGLGESRVRTIYQVAKAASS